MDVSGGSCGKDCGAIKSRESNQRKMVTFLLKNGESREIELLHEEVYAKKEKRTNVLKYIYNKHLV